MDTSLHSFINQYLRVVALTLVPVVLTAFLAIPYTLEGHPGDVRTAETASSQHMT